MINYDLVMVLFCFTTYKHSSNGMQYVSTIDAGLNMLTS